MSRVIGSKKDRQGELYHFCPWKQENITIETCRPCPHMVKLKELPKSYAVRCGYVVEGEVQLKHVSPAAAHGGSKESPVHTWIEPKLDGARALVHCTPDGVFITSRRRNKEGAFNQFQDNVPHLRDHPVLIALGKVGYTVLDGEIMAGNGLGSTMSIVSSKPERAIKVQEETGWAILTLFDIVWYEGQDVSELALEQRRRLLDQCYSHIVDDLIKLIPVWACTEDIEQRKVIYEQAIEQGYEGLVIKDPSSTYGDRKAWIKVKQHMTVDGIVTGWGHGHAGGKWEHVLGDLKVSVIDKATGELREICRTIPGDDAVRARLYDQLKDLDREQIIELGIVVEMYAQGWAANYRLRHPRIVRFRPDRSEPNDIDFSEVQRI